MDRISGSMQNTINEIWSKFLNAGGICVRQKSGFSNLFARQHSAEVAFLVLFPIISLSFILLWHSICRMYAGCCVHIKCVASICGSTAIVVCAYFTKVFFSYYFMITFISMAS